MGLIDKVLAPASSNKRPAPQWQRPKAKGKVERINPNERTVGRSGGLFVWVTFTQCDSVGSPPRFAAAEIAVAHKPVVVIGDSPALFRQTVDAGGRGTPMGDGYVGDERQGPRTGTPTHYSGGAH